MSEDNERAGRPATGSQSLSQSRVRSVVGRAPQMRRPSAFFIVAVIVLTVGLAAVWSLLAHRELATATATRAGPPSAEALDHAHKGFMNLRARSQEALQSHCRVMGEDPRLKSTLNTEGIDTATVADILADLLKLRRSGFLMVLTPDGKVFAQAGAKELQGLDLSGSAIVKAAQESDDAVVGAWVINNKVMDLAVRNLRFADRVIGALVVGEAVDDQLLEAVAAQSGVAVASALGDKIVVASSTDGATKAAFETIKAETATAKGRIVAVDGQSFITAVVNLEETTQAHRLLLVRPVVGAASNEPFEKLKWMLLVPPALVLLAVLFALSGNRSSRRMA